jgi:hypothetical protein
MGGRCTLLDFENGALDLVRALRRMMVSTWPSEIETRSIRRGRDGPLIEKKMG